MASLTNLGDLAVLLPVSAIILVWLASRPHRRSAVFWAVAVLAVTGAIGLMKIYFSACSPDPVLRSPSGHAGFSTLVYGAITVILASTLAGWRRLAVITLGFGLVVGIGASRVLLSAHSPFEVVIGMTAGLMALGLFAWGYLRPRPVPASLWPVTISVLVAVAFLHGTQVRAEVFLHRLGSMLHVGSIACTAPLNR